MFRKLCLAATAAIALGTAALAPTSASAWWDDGWHPVWRHHWWHGGWGWRGPHFYYGAYGYDCRRWIATPWGPRPRWVC
jgi:hypothetical protein